MRIFKPQYNIIKFVAIIYVPQQYSMITTFQHKIFSLRKKFDYNGRMKENAMKTNWIKDNINVEANISKSKGNFKVLLDFGVLLRVLVIFNL